MAATPRGDGSSRGPVRVAAMAVACLCALAWAVGRLCTDRFAWSQPLWWAPSVLLLAPVWLLAVLPHPRRRARRAAHCAFRLFAAAALAYTLVAELRVHRWASPAAPEGAIRVVFWNQAGRPVASPDILRPVRPDALVVANRHTGSRARSLAESLASEDPAAALSGWPFDCLARWPVRRWGSTSLGLSAAARGAEDRLDTGWAAWFEIDTPDGPLVVWAIDLPSDPAVHRMAQARQAAAVIAGWRGPVRASAGLPPPRRSAAGFPVPDVVVGDFNTPRGSASLRVLLREAGAPGMRDAFAEAGRGWARTWPRRAPLWAIDHCFVGPRWRAERFGVFDPGEGGHRAVWVALSARAGPAE